MASVNRVILVGNLGRDPEVRFLASGDAIANLAIATSYKPKDKPEVVEWHRVSMFGRMAEVAGQYLKKGSAVYIEGRLQTHKYTDKDGVEKYATDIVCETMQMLGTPQAQQSQQAAAPARQQAQRQAPPARPAPGPGPSGFDDLEGGAWPE